MREKGVYAAVFAVLAFLGSIVGQVASAAWRTDDRIERKAAEVAQIVGADAARRVVKEEIGPAVAAAVTASVKPLSDEIIRHVSMDDERQRRTDEAVRRMESLAHQHGGSR